MIEFKPKSKKTDLTHALRYFSNVMKKKAIVFILSDFIDTGYDSALKIVGKKHDVTGIRVYDKHDVTIPNLGVVPIRDAETGKTILANTASKKVRRAYEGYYADKVDYYEKTFSHSGAGTISTRIDESYVKKLLGYFKNKGAR